MAVFCSSAQVAQSVEQRTENPRVDGSIPPLGTMNSKGYYRWDLFCFYPPILLRGLALSNSLQSRQNSSMPNFHFQKIVNSLQINENKLFIFSLSQGFLHP